MHNTRIITKTVIFFLFLGFAITGLSADAPKTVWASGSDTFVGWPAVIKGYATDADANIEKMRFYVSGPGLPGWNQIAEVPAIGAHPTASTTWTPTQAGTYSVHIRAIDSTNTWDSNASVVSSFTVNAANRAPITRWAGASNPFLGQAAHLTASVSDPDGNLKYVVFYVSGPGLPAGWNSVSTVSVTGATANVSTTWTPPSTGNYTVHIRAQDQSGTWDSSPGIVSPFDVTASNAPYRFQILIDINQLGGYDTSHPIPAEINQTGSFSQLASDGMMTTTGKPSDATNSPNISESQWPNVFSLLGPASKWVIGEDEYHKLPWEWNYVNTYRGSRPNAMLVYDEQTWRYPIGRAWLEVTLGADEIAAANSICNSSNNIVVLSRTYNGGGMYPALPNEGYEGIEMIAGIPYPVPIGRAANNWVPPSPAGGGYLELESDLRGYWVDVALESPGCAGVTFETNPDASSGGWVYQQNFIAGIQRCLALGKKCYLLLPPKPGVTNYTTDVITTMQNLFGSRSDLLNNPNLYIVPAVYSRYHSGLGFLVGDNGNPVNSVLSAANQLKIFRSR